MFGCLVPAFSDGKWHYEEVISDETRLHRFAEDCEDYSVYIGNPNQAVFLAYVGLKCVGRIRIRKNWNKYCYVEDIQVSRGYRKQGIASRLLQAAEAWAKERGLPGFMLEAQDFNLGACRFYARTGFILGGVDNMLYYNTGNRGDLVLIWYKLF
ncbi:MAG: GNAT family N-acetyltransferase [Clostridiaceae bacterium]|nr:GNAT family N-acetyltransferase [Clostridiaceae bacterium]